MRGMGDVHPKRPMPVEDWIAAVAAPPNIKMVERLGQALELLGQRVEPDTQDNLADLGRVIVYTLVELMEAAAEGGTGNVAVTARKLTALVNQIVDHPDIVLAQRQLEEKRQFQQSGAMSNAMKAKRVSGLILAEANKLLDERPESFRTAARSRIKVAPLAQALARKGIKDPDDPNAKPLVAGTIGKHLRSLIREEKLK